MAKKLSEGQIDEMVKEYVNGATIEQLVNKYRVGNRKVTRLLKEHVVRVRTQGERSRKLSESQIDDVVKKYEDGFSTLTIGKEYGVCDATIAKALRKRGVELRHWVTTDWPEEKYQEIVQKYKDGKNTPELGKEYGISSGTVGDILNARGVKLRNKPHLLTDVEKDEIVKKFLAGTGVIKLKEEYSVGVAQISRLLKERGINPQKYSAKLKRKLSDKQIDEIVKKYEAGDSTVDLSREYNVFPSGIKRVLDERGVKIRRNWDRKDFSESQIQDIIKRYQDGENAAEIGRKYNTSNQTIGKILRKNGVEIRIGKVSPKQKDDIVDRYKAGESTTELGKAYGVTSAAILYVLKESGVEIRRKLYDAKKELARKLL